MQQFLKSETGAVTVDWIVLTAGLVGLGLATMAVVSTGVQDASRDTQSAMTGVVITGFRSDRGMAMQSWYDARVQHLEAFGLTPPTWAEHQAEQNALDDTALLAELADDLADTPVREASQAALQAYVDSGHDPAMLEAYYNALRPTHTAQQNADKATGMLSVYSPEELVTGETGRLGKQEARLEWYQLEAEARGL